MRSLLVLILLAFCFVGHSQIINFPDPNFKNALVNTKCVDTDGDSIGDSDADLNNDGEIDESEAESVIKLLVNNKNISNIEGILKFKNLTSLFCSSNNITSLNVQGLNKLEYLYCNNNQFTTLNLQGLINLKKLDCSGNKLPYLDVENMINLVELECNYNFLSTIFFKGSTNLKHVSCGNNQISYLDLDGLTNLSSLSCGFNRIYNLEINKLYNLTSLACGFNLISKIDIKGLQNLKYFNCIYNQINDLDLQNMNNLEYLLCSANRLAQLDVKSLKNLKELYCDSNHLSNIDLKELINLERLNCGYNQLTSLDLDGLINLNHLNCQENQLTLLDIDGLNSLEHLNCQKNQLTSINMDGLSNLTHLDCQRNQLTSLDIIGMKNLNVLYCQINQLTFLNVQNLTELSNIFCYSNQLKTINIKGNRAIDLRFFFLFKDNPNLNYICCDEHNIISIKNISIFNGQNCEVNSYCSFTPGGKFYTIKGNNAFDVNNSGCDDQDLKASHIKYNITNGTASGTFLSNSTGNYSFPVQAGTHTITPILQHPDHFEITPSSFTITFPSITSDTITQNFCITPKGILRQTNITVIPLTPPARPGFDASYKIIWENVGNQIESGTLNFTYDETLLDYISATQSPDQIADGIVKWNFTNLLPFEKREIIVTLKVNRPTDTPAVNAGDKLYLTASILDNIFTLENTVVGSYDPNDKTCLQGDRVKPDMVGKYVDYLIRFENTGNYAAENVVIKDIIDTKTFDVSSLQITDASHEVYTRIEGNKVEFIFEDIQLPFDDANNDGYVAFKIKTLPSLVLGDSLKNLADIYFDYNFPIRTNEAQTTIALPSFTKDIATQVNIYPNPVQDILYLESDENWSKAEIYDISGRILRSVSFDGQSIDVSGLESGTYFVRLKDGDRVGVVKFVKI